MKQRADRKIEDRKMNEERRSVLNCPIFYPAFFCLKNGAANVNTPGSADTSGA